MPIAAAMTLTRRMFLASALSTVLPFFVAGSGFAGAGGTRVQRLRLNAVRDNVRLVPEPYAETPVWCYNGTVPGPEIRIRQGDRVQVVVENGLEEETTVHWHGLRIPNDMDGVPHLTQRPIGIGETFAYEFETVDAGTFWYHPHQRSFEQVGRGLYGALVVEEHVPVRVDRDMTWILDDWRLTRSAAISDDFGNSHDISHNGRVGNTVTINGRVPDVYPVRTGERVRLRLINAANARTFGLDFASHSPTVIALDGQPVAPHPPDNGLVVLGPAMRVDLILDMTGEPESRSSIIDRYYQGLEYRLADLVYESEVFREVVPDWPMELPPNPLKEPQLSNAARHDIEFSGGMMGGMVMREMGREPMGGMASMMDMMHSGKVWFVNGKAAQGHVMDPLLTLERNRSCVLAMTNMTAWDHPIHLHGHSFRVMTRNGQPTKHREWQDTVLMRPRERVEIAFVADNPGDWMFHCHVLEHQAAGMMAVIRVT